jgi:hypothetical protein
MTSRILPLVCALAVACSSRAADWTAPDDPEPQKILQEAQEDARAGRYEEALARHIWYHRNALKYDSGQSGVRLSFALSSWKQLADKFTPAMDDLKAERDAAKKRVLEGKNLPSSMGDLAGLNRTLGDEKQTAEAFLAISRDYPAHAALAYLWAEDALIKDKQYDVCASFCDPERTYQSALSIFQHTKKFAAGRAEPAIVRETNERLFTKKAATIVALMVITKRPKEAESIATKARTELDSDKHRQALDEALAGKMPENLN